MYARKLVFATWLTGRLQTTSVTYGIPLQEGAKLQLPYAFYSE